MAAAAPRRMAASHGAIEEGWEWWGGSMMEGEGLA